MSKTQLEQTKGQFKLVGKVKGIQNENSYREGVTKKDEQHYKSLSFFVETSDSNAIKVEMFGMVRDEVIFYSSKDKKSKRVKWVNRNKSDGHYKLLGVRMSLEKDSKGQDIPQMMVEYDAIDYLMENLKDGDDIYLNGEIDFQTYQAQDGSWVSTHKYIIKSLGRTKKAIDFTDENFVETSAFEQDIVVTEVENDNETNKVYVNAKVIKYGGVVADTQFAIDKEKNAKLAGNILKRLKFGDAIKVFGLCLNKSIEKAVEIEDEDDWGGEKPSGISTGREYVRELQITAVDTSTYIPKKYREEDFINEEEDNFGNVTSKGDDFDFEDDMEDDELPFE